MEYQVKTVDGLLFAYHWKEPLSYVFQGKEHAERLFNQEREFISWAIYERITEGRVSVVFNPNFAESGYHSETPRSLEVMTIWEDGSIHECQIPERYFLNCEDFRPYRDQKAQ